MQIIWDNRFAGEHTQYKCKVTVDGTDFKIRQPTEFNTMWYSKKFNGPGLRYEVGICIQTGHIVWINGPYPCGANHDITIFRKNLKWCLNQNERVEADKGYRGEDLFVSVPEDYRNEEHKKAKNHARARHEQVNQRFKQFQCLHQTFRNDISKHTNIFWAAAVVVQLSLQFEQKIIWQVDYTGETIAEMNFF